jgi:DNA mismatch repair protein MSH6
MVLKFPQSFRKLNKGMMKLIDEAESFASRTISGLLSGAPDLSPNINNVESMFQSTAGESTWNAF